uniref:Translation factor GUF1, mitochondrial n=1 Tax=Lygus hesperus TaxID=30085 RepID=A0A0A9YMR9_LYGHE
MICPRHEAAVLARRVLKSLKDNLTRSVIDLPLQALVGQKIITRETIKAYSKDVTAKIHAGDISRKMKKWGDQKKGKEKIARRSFGTIHLDQSILAAAMNATMIR